MLDPNNDFYLFSRIWFFPDQIKWLRNVYPSDMKLKYMKEGKSPKSIIFLDDVKRNGLIIAIKHLVESDMHYLLMEGLIFDQYFKDTYPNKECFKHGEKEKIIATLRVTRKKQYLEIMNPAIKGLAEKYTSSNSKDILWNMSELQLTMSHIFLNDINLHDGSDLVLNNLFLFEFILMPYKLALDISYDRIEINKSWHKDKEIYAFLEDNARLIS